MNEYIDLAKKLYDHIDLCADYIPYDIEYLYLTLNTCRNGRKAIWYYDGINREAAMYVDTEEFLTDEEIEKELV